MMPVSASVAIGLDVGGTKIAGGLLDLSSGKVLASRSVLTRPERGGQAVLADALELTQALLGAASTAGTQVTSLGLGLCELVDLTGAITSGHTVQWEHLPVRQQLASLVPTVVIESDVRAHALAEAVYGVGKNYRVFVFVTVGTGISSCLVQDGRPYAGAHGNALILASTSLSIPCPVCGNTHWPSLEEFASGPGLAARYTAQTGRQVTRAEEVMTAAQKGDTRAFEILQSAGQSLGAGLGWLVNVLDPEALVIGGGLGSAQGMYWETLLTATRAHIWAETSRNLPILSTSLGPDAGWMGAALAGAQQVFPNPPV